MITLWQDLTEITDVCIMLFIHGLHKMLLQNSLKFSQTLILPILGN